MYVTKNFKWKEFGKYFMEYTAIQKKLILLMAETILQPLRDYIGKQMIITSGVRDLEDYFRLEQLGYYPSDTSDHYYATPVYNPDMEDYYYLSTGAVAFWFNGDIEGLFYDVLPKVKSSYKEKRYYGHICLDDKSINIGQWIYEKHGSSEWIHVSNPANEIFGNRLLTIRGKKYPFLKSTQGGKYDLV